MAVFKVNNSINEWKCGDIICDCITPKNNGFSLFDVIFQCEDDKNREIVSLNWTKLMDVCKHEGNYRAVRMAAS